MTASSALAPVPEHVPANLVFDFDVYYPPGAQDDYHLAFYALHQQGVPDIFWTPQRGGHWVATRGEDIYHIFKNYEHFSSEWSTVPHEEHGRLPPIHFNPPDHADTVASALGFVAHFLARNPEHRQQLIDHPELAPRAADEFLRRLPVVNQGRVVAEDFVYKGVSMKKGEMIIMPTTLHGLDDRCFDRPLEVDFERTSRTYSTFGNGVHRCPGSFLARVEMKVFLIEWLKRIPNFRVKPGEKVGVSGGVNGCLHYLPLEWDVNRP